MRSFLSLVVCFVVLLPVFAVEAIEIDRTNYDGRSLKDVEDIFFERLTKDGKLVNRSLNDLRYGSLLWSMIGKRFSCLRSDASGNYSRQWTLANDFKTFLGGPPLDLFTLKEGRYFVGAACRAHNCRERAIIIADLQTRQIAYGLVHYFAWMDGRLGKKNKHIGTGLISVFVDPKATHDFADIAARETMDWAWDYLINTYYWPPEIQISKGSPPLSVYAVSCEK